MQTNGNKNAPPGIDSEQYAAALRVGLKWKLVIVRDVIILPWANAAAKYLYGSEFD